MRRKTQNYFAPYVQVYFLYFIGEKVLFPPLAIMASGDSFGVAELDRVGFFFSIGGSVCYSAYSCSLSFMEENASYDILSRGAAACSGEEAFLSTGPIVAFTS